MTISIDRRASRSAGTIAGTTLLAACAALLALVIPGAATAQELPAFRGPGACQGCHYQAVGLWKNRGVESFVTLDEARLWTESDRHANACNHIDPAQNELAARIYQNLRIENYEQEWVNQRQCLSCHANWLPEQEQPPPFYMTGVSCESCHGPSGAWDIPHREESWRLKDPQTEKKKLGMIPVRHPVARAEQCFACHIGNAAEQKVVTHTMYAAGHPPLPNIEIESFVRRMPRHWRYLPEKGDFKHREEFIKLHYGSAAAANDLPRTKAVVVGGAVALRFYLELLAAQTADDSPTSLRWPELAVYDCSGCHHDLKSPSWRQLREDYGRGRPRLLEWPTLLAEHVSLPLLGDEETTAGFNRRMQKIRQLLAERPFGPPPEAAGGSLAEAAGEFADWLKPQEEHLAALRINEAQAREVARTLAAASQADLWDFYTARQLAAAWQTVQLELSTPYPAFEPMGTTPLEQATGFVKQYRDWRCGPLGESKDALNQRLADLKLLQTLSLARLETPACADPSAPLQQPKLADLRQLRADLMHSAAKYDARWFQQKFQELAVGTVER